jgi:excisionase family DNA binding protein
VSTLQPASMRFSPPRLALTAMEAPEALGVSYEFFREHVAGELRWVRRGRKRLVSVKELERWLEQNAARVLEDAA